MGDLRRLLDHSGSLPTTVVVTVTVAGVAVAIWVVVVVWVIPRQEQADE
jgi:hypothetical protein